MTSVPHTNVKVEAIKWLFISPDSPCKVIDTTQGNQPHSSCYLVVYFYICKFFKNFSFFTYLLVDKPYGIVNSKEKACQSDFASSSLDYIYSYKCKKKNKASIQS